MPPRKFKDCVAAGGRVRTIKAHADTYRRICFKGGKSFTGHQKRTKRKRKK